MVIWAFENLVVGIGFVGVIFCIQVFQLHFEELYDKFSWVLVFKFQSEMNGEVESWNGICLFFLVKLSPFFY